MHSRDVLLTRLVVVLLECKIEKLILFGPIMWPFLTYTVVNLLDITLRQCI
jgi:hypothetical protein